MPPSDRRDTLPQRLRLRTALTLTPALLSYYEYKMQVQTSQEREQVFIVILLFYIKLLLPKYWSWQS